MTGNGLLGELVAWTGLATPPPASATAAAPAAALASADSAYGQIRTGPILDVCDRVIGETGRRSHVLEWLRPSGDAPLVVDAYYPHRELVVICQRQAEWHDSLVAEALKQRGLELFRINLADFNGDSGRGFSRLIGELGLIAKGRPAAPMVERKTLVFPSRESPAAPSPTAPQAAPAPPPTFPLPPAVPPPPIYPPPTFPSTPRSAPADVPSVSAAFQPLRAAVHRFTAAPQPFVMPTERMEPAGAERSSAAPRPSRPAPAARPQPTPVSAALQQYLAAPRPAPPPPRPASPPPSRTPSTPASPPPVSDALQRYLAARPSIGPTPPPARPTRPAPAAAPKPFAATPLPFAHAAPLPFAHAAPLPFAHAAPVLDPVLEDLIAGSAPADKRRRVGQRQAEAAARAARFVDARTARSPSRDAGPPRAAATPHVEPENGTWAARAAVAFPGIGLSPGPDARVSAPPSARAQAIERALARGRAMAGPERPPAPQQSTIDPDDIPLGMLVAIIVVLELIVGVVLCMFGGGPVVLGFGLVLDAAARVVGTIAAVRSGKEWGSGWRWICGLGGSPGVVAFAFQRDGRFATTELAPLAGPIAIAALVLILIGLAGIPVGV